MRHGAILCPPASARIVDPTTIFCVGLASCCSSASPSWARSRRRWTGAASGHGSVLVVEGAAGIGKSSLLAAAAERRATACGCCRHAASPLEQAYAFGTVRALFDPVRATGDWDGADRGRRRARAATRSTRPGRDRPRRRRDPRDAARAVLARGQPAPPSARSLLVVDDAHWADPPSLRWLGHLARRIDALPLLLLLAVRSGEPPSDPRAARRPPRPRRRCARGRSGRRRPRRSCARRLDADDAVCAACHDATGGNPFLVTRSRRALAAGADPATIGHFGPEAVAREVARRLDRLPAGAREVALAVAILGAGRAAAPRGGAGRTLGATAPRAAADALRTAGLLAPGARLEFAHPILAAAVAAGLGPGQTALRHRRAWRLLHVDGADPERQALQLLAGRARGGRDRRSACCAPRRRRRYARGAPGERDDLPAPRAGRAARRGDAARRPARVRARARRSPARATRPRCCARRSSSRPTPRRAPRPALRAARALALAALYDDMVEICRMALADPGGARPETVARLEAELVGLGDDARGGACRVPRA